MLTIFQAFLNQSFLFIVYRRNTNLKKTNCIWTTVETIFTNIMLYFSSKISPLLIIIYTEEKILIIKISLYSKEILLQNLMCEFRQNIYTYKYKRKLLVHSEKWFDWIKENDLFERLSLIWKNDLFELIKICLILTKYLWTK